jgi:hypothetical protein
VVLNGYALKGNLAFRRPSYVLGVEVGLYKEQDKFLGEGRK